MKQALGALVILSVFGCYNTYRVPTEELYRLNFGRGSEAIVHTNDGDAISVSPKSQLTFETDDGQRSQLQLTEGQVAGNVLSGRLKAGQPVQIDLPRIAVAEVRNYSGAKTGILASGIVVGVIGLVVVLVLAASGAFGGDSGY